MAKASTRPNDVLIIVDLQRAFSVPPDVVEGINRYARRFRCRVFTRFVNPNGSLFRKLLKVDSCAPGSADTSLQLAPRHGDLVLTKQGYGLTVRHLARLRRMGVKRATVCGIDTDACVIAVMFSLFDAGIDCRVKADLCWSANGLHREALKIISAQFPTPR